MYTRRTSREAKPVPVMLGKSKRETSFVVTDAPEAPILVGYGDLNNFNITLSTKHKTSVDADTYEIIATIRMPEVGIAEIKVDTIPLGSVGRPTY